ncbi:hypothetical protein ELY21_02310 [Legionella sp. km535]|uniref:hypothetical protein n=1 Tax=Legionella sp. km535 TaxID=2498107 RepID=UPI000F8EDFF5|nr:hypothetical protein [Legionella sp. km535]RUR19911.1 hypothetical protein ELY21_02310 [Legionella sp. km535]
MYSVDIFDVNFYRAFSFEKSLRKIYQNSGCEKKIIHSKEGYFAIPMVIVSESSDIDNHMRFNQNFFNRQKIIVGKFDVCSSSGSIPSWFIYELISEEGIWIRHFLDVIVKHLTERVAEGTKIISHNNVRILIGKTVQALEELGCLINCTSDELAQQFSYVKEVINIACNYLAKLAGGRAFFSNSIVEMLCTFEVLNNIYLINGK